MRRWRHGVGGLALWRPSLFRRLLGMQALIGALVWGAFCMGIWTFVQRDGEGIIDGDLQLRSQTLARMAQLQGEHGDVRGVVDQLVRLNLRWTLPLLGFEDVGYQLHHAERGLVVRGGSMAMPLSHWSQASGSGRLVLPGWRAEAAFSPDGRWLAVVAYRQDWVARFQAYVVERGAMSYALLMLLLWAALWASAWVGLRPLRRLTELLDRRAPDELGRLDTAETALELQPLVDALNDKMTRLHALIQHERQFFADAAHELRTPLAALGVQAHRLAGAAEAGERQTALHQLEHGVERCAAVLDKLLRLAQLDSGRSPARLAEVDVALLARGLVAEQAPRAIACGSSLGYLGPEALPVRADAEQLRVALECLVDNAIRYTPPGSEILVNLCLDGRECRLLVSDDGLGIAAAQREQVFERFVRLQVEQPGSGLGLAIVRKVAELHSGRAWVTAREPRGCEFGLAWPAG